MYAREYELIFIVKPDVTDEAAQSIVDRTSKIVTDAEGTVLNVDDWGNRRLAYDIKDFGKGHYFVLTFLGDSRAVDEIERTLKIDEQILRFLTIKVGERVDVEERKASEEARKAAAVAGEAQQERAPAGV